VIASQTLYGDDTPVPVLAPGSGKTKTGRIWTYVRDERPFGGARPPAALFFYSSDRKGELGHLYAVEQPINGSSPDQRRQQRQLRSKPIAQELAAWAEQTVPKLSRKSELAAAFRYMRARWTALTCCLEDGRLGLDNNPAERALRGVAIGRKNYLFAGSDAGGRRAAAMYSLIETAKLNGVNPQAYLADVLARIADHPAKRVAELLPWNWQPANLIRAAA